MAGAFGVGFGVVAGQTAVGGLAAALATPPALLLMGRGWVEAPLLVVAAAGLGAAVGATLGGMLALPERARALANVVFGAQLVGGGAIAIGAVLAVLPGCAPTGALIAAVGAIGALTLPAAGAAVTARFSA